MAKPRPETAGAETLLGGVGVWTVESGVGADMGRRSDLSMPQVLYPAGADARETLCALDLDLERVGSSNPARTAAMARTAAISRSLSFLRRGSVNAFGLTVLNC